MPDLAAVADSGNLGKGEVAAEYREKHGLSYHIQVDGGIYPHTLPPVLEAGANAIVAGTALFGAQDMGAEILKMRQM